MKEILRYTALAFVAALFAACDKVPLLAPANSTITLSANALTVPIGGTVGLTAFVTEPSGTPVQNGTSVRFTTTLGTVSPPDTQTTNGIAVATFQAGASSGIAEIHAISGGATGTSSGTGTTTTTTNSVKISVGAAAVNTITLRANPSSVGPNGGSVELIASLVTENGGPIQNVPVTFNADQGTLTVQTVPTDVNGEARTVLTTAQKTSVTATAGTKTSSAVTVDLRVAPGVTVTCAPATGGATASCANLQASSSNNTAAVSFTVTKGANTSNLRDATIDFGDGTAQSLGTLAGGAATVTHSYAGPTGSSPRGYTATVRVIDVNNETTNVSTSLTITPRAQLTVELTADTSAAAVPGVGKTVTFTATVSGGDAAKFDWDFADGDTATTTTNKTTHVYRSNGQKTPTVTVTTTDGRTATGRTEFIITGI
jgi:Big-like domain-containing protein/PKD domain-containing protein